MKASVWLENNPEKKPQVRAWIHEICRHLHDSTQAAAARPRGLIEWGRRLLPDHFRLPPSGMHIWLADQLDSSAEARGLRMNVIGPRGGAKSTVVTLAHVLRAALEKWERYIWIISDTQAQAHGHLENIKHELRDNGLLREAYPAATGKGATWRASAIVLRNGVRIEAHGTGQHIRGRRNLADRPTLIVCDDLQNDQHMQSPARRTVSRNWFHGALMPAGTKRTNIVHLATALHREALALELGRTPGWSSRTFQAIERWPADMLLWQEWEAIYGRVDEPESKSLARAFYDERRKAMDAGVALLWPEEEDLYTLMCQRVAGGRAAFEREKQGAPINPALCEWPESYFEDAIWFDRWPLDLQVRTLALDPSKGNDARRGDYSAFVMLGIDAQGILYVEANLARRPTPQIVADGVELWRRFHPDAFGVESNQFQELLAGEFAAEFERQNLLGVQPWTLDNRVNKQVRIRRLGPYLSNRRLRFKSDCPATRLLVEQLREFPTGDHDDGPDALEMALRLAAEMLGAPATGDGLGDRLPLGQSF